MTDPSKNRPRERRLISLADWLDTRFRVPGTNYRFGLDGLLGLIPVAGDTATMFLSAYLLVEAYRLGLPKPLLARMGWNILLDFVIGSVPVVGDLFDFAWKANSRNLKILSRHLNRRSRTG